MHRAPGAVAAKAALTSVRIKINHLKIGSGVCFNQYQPVGADAEMAMTELLYARRIGAGQPALKALIHKDKIVAGAMIFCEW